MASSRTSLSTRCRHHSFPFAGVAMSLTRSGRSSVEQDSPARRHPVARRPVPGEADEAPARSAREHLKPLGVRSSSSGAHVMSMRGAKSEVPDGHLRGRLLPQRAPRAPSHDADSGRAGVMSRVLGRHSTSRRRSITSTTSRHRTRLHDGSSRCLARFNRLRGQDVFFLTGTDDHGQKSKAARRKGSSLSSLPGRSSAAPELCGASAFRTTFHQTTDPRHKKGCKDFSDAPGEANLKDLPGLVLPLGRNFLPTSCPSSEGTKICPDCGNGRPSSRGSTFSGFPATNNRPDFYERNPNCPAAGQE